MLTPYPAGPIQHAPLLSLPRPDFCHRFWSEQVAECQVPLGVLMDGQRHAFLHVPLYKPSATGQASKGDSIAEPCLDAEGVQSSISFTLQYLE